MPRPTRLLPSGRPEVDLDYIQILRGILKRRKKVVIAVFLLIAFPLLGLSLYGGRPRFQSSGTVLITPSIVDRISATREFASVSGTPPVQVAVLRSRTLAQEVLDALPKESLQELMDESLEPDYFLTFSNEVRRLLNKPRIVVSPQQRAVAELQGSRMEFQLVRRQDEGAPNGLVRISATAFNPRVAMDLVNTYVQVLVNWTRRSEQEDVSATRKFLEVQVGIVQRDLKEAEAALTEFEDRYGGVKLTDRTQFEVGRLVQLQGTLAEVQANQAVARSKLDALEKALPLPSAAESAAGAAERIRARLRELEPVLQQMRAKYTEEHPSLIAVRQEIENLRGQLAQLPLGSAQDPRVEGVPMSRAEVLGTIGAVNRNLANLQPQEQSLRLQIDQLRKNLRSLSGPEFDYARLLRSRGSNRALLSSLSDKLLALQIREQAQAGVVKIIDPAHFPVFPIQNISFRKLAFLVAVALGTAGALGFLVEYIYEPVESEKTIRRHVDLPFLGSAVEVSSRQPKGDRRPLLVFNKNPKVAMSQELYRVIRTNLEAENLRNPVKTMMIASPCPGEGKSTTAINLAMALRELGRRVVLVDADLRHPSLSKVLSSEAKGGLTDLLQGALDVEDMTIPIVSRGNESRSTYFAFIPSGSGPVEPGALLSSARAKDLVASLRQQWDYVLFDSAPLLLVSDNVLFATALDAVILVVQAEQTKKRDLQRAKDLLEGVGARILGVILNRVSPRRIPYYYRRYERYYRRADRARGSPPRPI